MTRVGRLIAVSHACVKSINRAIYEELASLGWDVSIVVPSVLQSPRGEIRAEPSKEGEPQICAMSLDGQNPRTYLFQGLNRYIANEQPDLVFIESDPISRLSIQVGRLAHSNKGKRFLVACLSCENLSQTALEVYRRSGWQSVPAAVVKSIMALQSRRVIDHVFTINQDGEKLFNRLGFSSVSKMPLGFDSRYFHISRDSRVTVRAQFGIDEDEVVIAYFGRMVPEKGVDHLVESLGRLKQLRWRLMLDQFEGTGNAYSNRIESMVNDLQIHERLCLINADHGEIARYMNAADVVVLPSISTPKWKEQYGRVAPEAMACGKTVVAYRSGALPELVGENGVIVDEGNITHLTEVLRRLITQDVDDLLSESAANNAAENLSVKAQARIMHERFVGMMRQRPIATKKKS